MRRNTRRGTVGRIASALGPAFGWAGALTLPLLGIEFVAVIQGGSRSIMDWLGTVARDLGYLLPFAAFAAGVHLHDVFGRRSVADALRAGFVAGGAAYLLTAIAEPLAEHAALVEDGTGASVSRPFGPDTPAGLLRNIRYVEENPPADGNYSLSVDHTERSPPEWLRVLLHTPMLFAAFAVVNTVTGLWVGQLTSGLPPPVRRNTRLGTALLGGVAFFVLVAWATLYSRDWTATSGVLATWSPLALPLVIAIALWAWTHLAQADAAG